METEYEKNIRESFLAQEIAKAVVNHNRPWWCSGGACLCAGSLLFTGLILVGLLAGWWQTGWLAGSIIVLSLVLAVSGAGQYSRSRR